MAQIHCIGKPETESEAAAIKYLSENLPPDYCIIHNFESCARPGELPYEYDICVLGRSAVYHVEVKHFTGVIRGDKHRWRFDSGHAFPSPIPLANKKSKILASRLRKHQALGRVYVDTVVLITDPRAGIRLVDDQADRVVKIGTDYAIRRLTDRTKLPSGCRNSCITSLHDDISDAIVGSHPTPSRKLKQIGLYNIEEKISQYDSHSVFLASHKYITTRPRTILKVYHFDQYANPRDREHQLKAIFHDQEALRLISSHPCIIRTGDFFASDANPADFVLPHEYFEKGRTLEDILDDSDSSKLTWQDKRLIIEHVAEGLKHCHKAGVIHRDLKPHSIVVVPSGDGFGSSPGIATTLRKSDDRDDEESGEKDEVQVKLVNFDLARIRSGNKATILKDAKDRLDPRYTAPEVWRDPLCASEASDVFSLGVTFYELITGHRPFEHIEEVIKKKTVQFDTERLVAELSAPGRRSFYGKPENIVRTIEQMLEVDPRCRHQSMDAVIKELNLLETEGLRRSERITSMRHLMQICD